MSKITDYPPGPGINGSEQVLIATPAGPLSTNYTYTMADIRTYAGGGGGGSGTVTSVGLTMPGIFSVANTPINSSGTLAVTATDPGADRVAFWDDSAGDMAWLTMGTNLSITGTTLNASGGGGVAWGAISGTLTDQTDLNTALGLKAPLASPTLTGTPAGPTAAVDTNTTQLATTAYVVGQAASATPANNGTAAVGTSTRYARGDHVHNSDSTKANLASPTLTGTPAAPTAAVDTNTTQIATTAFVLGQAASATPAAIGTAAVGTSTRYARGDHVHGTPMTTSQDIIVGGASGVATRLAVGANGTFLGVSGGTIGWTTPSGSGDVVGPASSTNGNLPSFANTTGKLLQDSGIAAANVSTMASGAAASGRVITSAGANRTQQDSGTLLSALATLASPVFTGDPTAPTPTTGDDDTSIATTAFVQASVTAIPQNSQSSAYTLVLADKGKHIFHPSADTTARIWTIPANSSVAFAVGTVVTFVNQNAAGVITIAITTDTMRLAGAGTTGSRTLAANGIATAIKVTSTEWQINGTGLT